MGRPPLAVGTFGKITTRVDGDGWRARTYVRDRDGRRREVSRWAPTKAAAERRVKDACAQRDGISDAADELGPDTRLAALAERWVADLTASTKAPNTKRVYGIAVHTHLEPALGGLRLRELTVPRVDGALRTIGQRHGIGAAKTARAVLSSMLGFAVRQGAMTTNPVREVSALEGAGRKVRALTGGEQERIQDAPRSSRRAVELDLPDLIDWMLGTGMRIGEACAIRARSSDGGQLLDLEAGTVEVNATIVRVPGRGLVVQERTKSAAGWRVLALPPDLVAMLRRRRDDELRLPGPDIVTVLDADGRTFRTAAGMSLVFTSPTGRLRDPSNTNADLREVLDSIDRTDGQRDAGEPGPFGWVTSHVFRKTVATRLDDAGLSARQIADVLGHEHPSMTQDVYMGRSVVSADAAAILARPGRAA